MSRMTAQDFVTMARLGLGGETAETLSDNLILRLINQSYMEIASGIKFPELETNTTVTTADGTAEYDLNGIGDILCIDFVTDDTNNLTMDRMDRSQYQSYTQGDVTGSSGPPVFWFVSGVASDGDKQVTFYPTPDGTYTIRLFYRKRPAELLLSPTPTSTILPETWDDSILQRAISRGWKLMGDPDLAMKFNALAKENDAVARSISIAASDIPTYVGSIAGWRG